MIDSVIITAIVLAAVVQQLFFDLINQLTDQLIFYAEDPVPIIFLS
jgi:hypothetical protein